MLVVLEAEDEFIMPGPWTTTYLITERRGLEPRHDDPEAGSDSRLGKVYDLRNPRGEVIESSSDLLDLRDKQAKYNIIAVQG